MTIVAQQQLRETAERLIVEGENYSPATVERFTEFATPATVLTLLDEIERLEQKVQEYGTRLARLGRAANWLSGYAEGTRTFSRIQEINDAIQEVPDGH